MTISLSFFRWEFIGGLKALQFNGLGNLISLWEDDWFVASLRNSLIYSFFSVIITTGVGLVFAVLVERFLKRGKGVIRLMYFTPYVTSIVVSSFVWQMMLSRQGIVQHLLGLVGIADPPIWLGETKWALSVIILIGIWRSAGYVFVLYLAGLQNIPDELYESAGMDGAGEMTLFRKITIPLLAPTTFFVLITRLIFSFRLFAEVQILTQGGPGYSTSVLAYYAYLSAFRFYKMGYASSVTVVMFMLILCFTLIQWRGQKKWSI